MIKINLPAPDVTITERRQSPSENEPAIKAIYGFIDFHQIPRDKGGIFMFYNIHDESLFVGKARKLRQRIKSILKTMCRLLNITGTKCIKLKYVS